MLLMFSLFRPFNETGNTESISKEVYFKHFCTTSNSWIFRYSKALLPPETRKVARGITVILRWFPSKRTPYRFQMKLGMLLLHDKDILQT